MRESKAVWCVLLTFAVTVLNPGLCVRFDTDKEFNSIVCPPLQRHPGSILDIHKSIDLGAKLVEGTWQSSLESCVSQCCLHDECDMALYKNQGVSQSGKNCYFVQCGDPKNCVVVEHLGFTSVSLDSSDADSITKAPRVDSSETSDSGIERSDMEPSPPSTDSEMVATVATTHSSSPASPTTLTVNEKEGNKKGSKEVTTPPKSPPTTKPPLTNSSSNKDLTTENKTSDQNAVESNKALSSTNDGSESHARTQDCGKYGCDGSGLIAVAVVGSICFSIVVLVVAVLLKRVVDDKRKKRFNNVDYLINGMYT